RPPHGSTTADPAAATPSAPTPTPDNFANEPRNSTSSPPMPPDRSVNVCGPMPTVSARRPIPTTPPLTPPRPSHEPTAPRRTRPHPRGHGPTPDRTGHRLQRQPHCRRPRRRGRCPPHGHPETTRRPKERVLLARPRRNPPSLGDRETTPGNGHQAEEDHCQSESRDRRAPPAGDQTRPRQRCAHSRGRQASRKRTCTEQRCSAPAAEFLNGLAL